MAGCLNTLAVIRLANLVSEYVSKTNAPAARQPNASLAIFTWPPTSLLCWPFAPHANGQAIEIVSACMRAVGIYPIDPCALHDERG
eukprot:3654469-Amphidinium_carterae.1